MSSRLRRTHRMRKLIQCAGATRIGIMPTNFAQTTEDKNELDGRDAMYVTRF